MRSDNERWPFLVKMLMRHVQICSCIHQDSRLRWMIIDQGRVQNGGEMIIRLLLVTLYRFVLGLYEEDELITQVASRILHLQHSKALFREAL